MADPVRYGVIGTGMMGLEHLLNLRLLAEAGDAVVTAIADPHEASRVNGRNTAPPEAVVYEDYRDLLADAPVDALEAGMTLFDTADIYGLDVEGEGGGVGSAEALLGRVFAEAPALRQRVVLATKGGIVPGLPYDSGAVHLRAACEASLRRLGVETIDLYQVHRPDWLAHPAEVAETLTALRQEGKVREVGVSNYSAAMTDALRAHLPFELATHQPEMSVWCLDPLHDGVLDQCMRLGMTPLAWSPLAGGLLGTDPVDATQGPEAERVAALRRALDGIAERQDASRTDVALAFLLAHPAGIVPIVGSQRPERIRAAPRALRVELTRSDWYDLVEASRGERLP